MWFSITAKNSHVTELAELCFGASNLLDITTTQGGLTMKEQMFWRIEELKHLVDDWYWAAQDEDEGEEATDLTWLSKKLIPVLIMIAWRLWQHVGEPENVYIPTRAKIVESKEVGGGGATFISLNKELVPVSEFFEIFGEIESDEAEAVAMFQAEAMRESEER